MTFGLWKFSSLISRFAFSFVINNDDSIIKQWSYVQPPNTPKRPAAGEEDDEDEWESAKKPKKVIKTPYHARQRQPKELDVVPTRNDEPATPVRDALPSPSNDVIEPQLTDKEKQDILKYVETEAPEVEALDEAMLKRMILLFEKRALRNQEMRVKFPDQPEKYVHA